MRDRTNLPLPPRAPPRNVGEAQVLYGRIKTIALWLDTLPINGYHLPFGLESIIGLIPTIGDIIGLALGMYIIYLASFFGLPSILLMKMFGHVLIDFIIGILPVVGDLFDVFYRSNIYNIHILESWLKEQYGNNIVIGEG